MSSNAILSGRNQPQISDAEFIRIRDMIYKVAGIKLADGKKDLVYRRLSGRLSRLGLNSFSDYCDYVQDEANGELQSFCDSLTTNFTSFFREQHHFDFLRSQFVDEMQQRAAHSGKRLRIWSAGCSSGEEPYSIAMTLLDRFPGIDGWDARILATDLDTNVLQQCRGGSYSGEKIDKVPADIRKRWFRTTTPNGDYVVDDRLRSLIVFKQLNLMGDWPMRGPFDIIFCRNVIIYFDKQTQVRLVERFAKLLRDGGYLIIGHSESLLNVSDRFVLSGKTIHRKIR